MGNFPTQELLETADRVTQRWQNALSEIEKAKYGPNEWLRDVVGFWTNDVADVWLGAGRVTRTVLLHKNNKKSDKIPVTKLGQVSLTTLGQLGGTKSIQLIVDKTPDDAADPNGKGTVIVKVPPVGFPAPAPAAGEQFVGLLYEDQTPIATVFYVEL
jgi:hypothetical protein